MCVCVYIYPTPPPISPQFKRGFFPGYLKKKKKRKKEMKKKLDDSFFFWFLIRLGPREDWILDRWMDLYVYLSLSISLYIYTYIHGKRSRDGL